MNHSSPVSVANHQSLDHSALWLGDLLAPSFLDWKIPVATAIAYYASVKFINQRIVAASAAGSKPVKSSLPFTALVFLHNVLLCVFSATCFAVTAPLWLENVRSRPLLEAYCDRDGKTWNSGLNNWSWLFYLSKYYEILDTVIILLKGANIVALFFLLLCC